MNASLLETNPFDMTLGEASRGKIRKELARIKRPYLLSAPIPSKDKKSTTYRIIYVDKRKYQSKSLQN